MSAVDAGERARAWLLGAGFELRFLEQVFAGLCAELREAGLPLERATIHSPALHPLFRAVRFLWEPGFEEAELMFVGAEMLHERPFLESPVRALFEGAEGLRQRLDVPTERPDTFPIYTDLRAQGFTDYAAMPLVFTNGQRVATSWSTRRAGGWTTGELVAIDHVRPLLAMAVEIRTLRRTGRNIAETYLGKRAGARVLEGNIQRGDIEQIEAVIVYLDMRGFTAFVEQSTQGEVIARLNAFFDIFGEPIEARGGEVLKFIGDGMLAVFPIDDQGQPTDAAGRAIDAASDGLARLATRNAALEREGLPPIACGLGVHCGAVSYGNIGTAARLDFTVIGSAVNAASRLQQLSRDLGEPLLVSEEVAALCKRELRPVGAFDLRGIAGRRRVFAPVEAPERRAAS